MKPAHNIQKIVGLTQLREGGVAYINMLAAMLWRQCELEPTVQKTNNGNAENRQQSKHK